MKTIFLFTDSRLTDLFTVVAAIGEDGEHCSTTKFDEATAPHCRFAMGLEHEITVPVTPSVIAALMTQRVMSLFGYAQSYGENGWIPIWVDSPHNDPAVLNALRLRRELRRDQEKILRGTDAFGASLLSAIFAAPDESQRVH